jgi:Protein of unknown function (DUF3800)
MFLMYVDKSGDSGLINSPSTHFVLSGLVIHESDWADVLGQILDFRQQMRTQFGLKLREEIHAAAFINKPGSLSRIKRNDRLTILRAFVNELSSMPQIRVSNIVVDKSTKTSSVDVFDLAWKALIQRFENTIRSGNFSVPSSLLDRGLILPDHTDEKKLRSLVRKMRYFNYLPSTYNLSGRNLPLAKIVEDPFLKDSEHSYLIQAVDVIAYFLFQNLSPNKYIKGGGAHNYFFRLKPILCLEARPSDPYGIVRL